MDATELLQQLPTLRTERLILRKLRLDDAADYFAFASDPRVTRYLRWGPHGSPEQTQAYLADVLTRYAEGANDGLWGIEQAGEQRLIGSIHLMDINLHDLKADVGIILHAQYWGKGLACEALRRVLAFSFGELGLQRVQALIITGNTAACRLMERCGMTHEGLLRRYALQKGQWWDFDVFSIIADDWDQQR